MYKGGGGREEVSTGATTSELNIIVMLIGPETSDWRYGYVVNTWICRSKRCTCICAREMLGGANDKVGRSLWRWRWRWRLPPRTSTAGAVAGVDWASSAGIKMYLYLTPARSFYVPALEVQPA